MLKRLKVLTVLTVLVAILASCFWAQSAFAEDYFASVKTGLTASSLIEFESFPEDRVLQYPEGTDLTVVVSNADKVDHIEWNVSDSDRLFTVESEDEIIDGKFVSTVHLYSSSRALFPLYFEPFVYDINGDALFSMDDIEVTLSNQNEIKPVVFIGEYAIEPGESLDISTTGYGSGIVSFAENATDVTLKNLNLNVTPKTFSWDDQSSQGILLDYGAYFFDGNPVDVEDWWEKRAEYLAALPYDYKFIIDGGAKIVASYLSEDDAWDGGWYGIQAFFSKNGLLEGERFPDVTFTGDKLTINGGIYGVITGGNVILDADSEMTPYDNSIYYSTGIGANDITLKGGHTNSFVTNGPALYADENIYIDEGTKLKTNSTPQRAGGTNYTIVHNISAGGSISIDGATLDITGELIPDRFVPFYNRIAGFNAIASSEGSEINNSTINITTTVPASDAPYAANINGIRDTGSNGIDINGSTINITLEAPTAQNSEAISSLGSINIKNSNITTKTNGLGLATGINARDELNITDSDVFVDSNSDDEEGEHAGIMASQINVDFTKKGYEVRSLVNSGAAFAVAFGNSIDEEDEMPEYTEGYEASRIITKNLAETIKPVQNTVNVYAHNTQLGSTYAAETFYDLTDTSAPALDVIISSGEANPDTSDSIGQKIAGLAVICLGLGVVSKIALRRRGLL